MRFIGNGLRYSAIGAVIALVAGLTQPAFAQQDNSGSSQMPTDQGASANTAAPTQLQPSEIQEQQIEGQQQPPAQPGG